MPASTVDTFLACSIMILLVLSVITGAAKLMSPYLNSFSHRNDALRFQQLGSHILLNPGTPPNWGQRRGVTPSVLGLAKESSVVSYELDIDKISRLNDENAFSITYLELWESLGIKDVAFQIEVKTLFEVSIELLSSETQNSQTIYEFRVVTDKGGIPVPSSLSGYVVIKSFVNKTSSFTSTSGTGTITVGIPNSINGTALLLVFAKAKANPRILAFEAYAFSHNSTSPLPNGTFTRLSPINHVLNVSFTYPNIEIQKAQVFTFNYNFSLSLQAQGVQSVEYVIPRLLDSSPMIMVLTGYNSSTSFTEWVSYPQLPLSIGADFSQSTAGSKTVSQNHLVTINFALYEVVTRWGGTA